MEKLPTRTPRGQSNQNPAQAAHSAGGVESVGAHGQRAHPGGQRRRSSARCLCSVGRLKPEAIQCRRSIASLQLLQQQWETVWHAHSTTAGKSGDVALAKRANCRFVDLSVGCSYANHGIRKDCHDAYYLDLAVRAPDPPRAEKQRRRGHKARIDSTVAGGVFSPLRMSRARHPLQPWPARTAPMHRSLRAPLSAVLFSPLRATRAYHPLQPRPAAAPRAMQQNHTAQHGRVLGRAARK